MFYRKRLAIVISSVLFSASTFAASQPSLQDLYQLIKQQQAQIEKLSDRLAENETQTEATADAIDTVSKTSVLSKSHFGGYGELHYNNLNSKKVLDLHRFVLFFDHEFNDDLRFASELEVEHVIASSSAGGEVEVEQAYIEYDFNDNLSAKAGIFLMPVGFINETHEPPAFYGVERNNVEKNIIPATWWEGGVAVSGRVSSGFSWDLALHSGLNVPVTGANSFLIRKGRQKVSEADASDLAVTARLKYNGFEGLELAASVQRQNDITAGAQNIGATLTELQAAVQRGAFSMKALYANWDLDSGVAATGPASTGRDKQNGWYIEPAFKVTTDLGVFARYSEWDNNAGSSSNTEISQFDLGLNYWLHEDVVLKADYQNQGSAGNDDGFNLGIGYQF